MVVFFSDVYTAGQKEVQLSKEEGQRDLVPKQGQSLGIIGQLYQPTCLAVQVCFNCVKDYFDFIQISTFEAIRVFCRSAFFSLNNVL